MTKKSGALPTLPGVASEPWYLHAGVRLPEGKILDPLLQRTFPSLEAFRRAIAGDAKVTTMINGQAQK